MSPIPTYAPTGIALNSRSLGFSRDGTQPVLVFWRWPFMARSGCLLKVCRVVDCSLPKPYQALAWTTITELWSTIL